MNDWQTWAVVGVVLLATLFLARKATGGGKKKKKGCGHDCGCGK
jgi:hypothetical protein